MCWRKTEKTEATTTRPGAAARISFSKYHSVRLREMKKPVRKKSRSSMMGKNKCGFRAAKVDWGIQISKPQPTRRRNILSRAYQDWRDGKYSNLKFLQTWDWLVFPMQVNPHFFQ